MGLTDQMVGQRLWRAGIRVMLGGNVELVCDDLGKRKHPCTQQVQRSWGCYSSAPWRGLCGWNLMSEGGGEGG